MKVHTSVGDVSEGLYNRSDEYLKLVQDSENRSEIVWASGKGCINNGSLGHAYGGYTSLGNSIGGWSVARGGVWVVA